MAAYNSYSPSPRVGSIAQVTPLHSPQHSINSSTSSRTPLQQLTLHEYRKQQNSPVPPSTTPPGKTLRRKAAAPALHDIERVPSTTSRAPVSTSRRSLRPLQISQSVHQLPYQPFPPSPPLFCEHNSAPAQLLRSRSAEPYGQGSAAAGELALHSAAEKVRNFKPIKRLPRPSVASGFGVSLLPLSPVAVTPPLPRLSTRRSTILENPISSDTETTPTTFSLSRFPQPPPLADPLAPPNDDNAPSRIAHASFTTTAPATPPATPAVIHYRGASFDLVNPHDSLHFHDIVTPSRDLDSTEFSPFRSSDDLLMSDDMAPKRALYGDLSTAYAGIIARRNEDFDAANAALADLPLPPLPAAQLPRTPTSSQYTESPLHSPDPMLTVSPLALKKPVNESRFSLKQLTRSLTRRLTTKTPETANEEELRDFAGSGASVASPSFEGGFPRPLEQSYRQGNARSTSSDGPATPISSLGVETITRRDSDVSMLQIPLESQRYSSAPLASMVSNEPFSELAEDPHPQLFTSQDNTSPRPYYEDLESIYSSSSVYTGDNHSGYQRSVKGERKSNPFARVSGDISAITDEYKSDVMSYHPDSHRTSRRMSRPLEQAMFNRSLHQCQQDNKTDTISKLIDQYKRENSGDDSQPVLEQQSMSNVTLARSTSKFYLEPAASGQCEGSGVLSSISQFDFSVSSTSDNTRSKASTVASIEAARGGQAIQAYTPGLPPAAPLPLASPFEYDELFDAPRRPNPSEAYSGASSYGDTRQLLQLSQPVVGGFHSGHALESSSSYSQSGAVTGGPTPQEALDHADEIFRQRNPLEAFGQAEEIFANMTAEEQQQSIPAMWSRRRSGNLLRNRTQLVDSAEKKHQEQEERIDVDVEEEAAADGEGGDWETVGDDSYRGKHLSIEDSFANYSRIAEGDLSHRDRHLSLGESIANYSSADDTSHGSRDSMGFSGNLSEPWEDPPLEPGSFQHLYQHPNTSRAHHHPFTSSPPQLATRTSSAPFDGSSSLLPSSAPFSTMAPAFGRRSGVNDSKPPRLVPWVDDHALSDKTTQELLASGPNDEIMYRDHPEDYDDDLLVPSGFISTSRSVRAEPQAHSSAEHCHQNRDNNFQKLTVISNERNITGNPCESGMCKSGNRVADNSSPGIPSSSPYGNRRAGTPGQCQRSLQASIVRSRIPSYIPSPSRSPSLTQSTGFYTVPDRRTSVHRVAPQQVGSNPFADSPQERSPSQVTLFPQTLLESPAQDRNRRSDQYSPRRARRDSRPAVYGQTKLRQMVLAPDAQTLASSSTRQSRHTRKAGSGRPSTANTDTPLNPFVSQSTMPTIIAYEHSPHLLCPERASDPEEEEQRRKLSWWIFAAFCALPPLLILFRFMGDFVMVNVTKGRLTHAALYPKKIALIAGIVVNVCVSGAILIPILIAHAVGEL